MRASIFAAATAVAAALTGPTPAGTVRAGLSTPSAAHSRVSTPVCSAGDEVLVRQLSSGFWEARRAQLKAEMEQRVRELEEYAAREAAIAASGGLPGASLAAPTADDPTSVAALQRELAAERARSAALRAELAAVSTVAEMNLQKTAAYWIERVRVESGEAPTVVPAAASDPTSAEPDLVAHVGPVVDEQMSLRELRAKLLTYGLSTIGLKSELRKRLAEAMYDDRQQYQSWDPVALRWTTPAAQHA